MTFSLTLPAGSPFSRAFFSVLFFLCSVAVGYSETVAVVIDDIGHHTTPAWRDVTEASVSTLQAAPESANGPKQWIGTYLDSSGNLLSYWHDSAIENDPSGWEETGAYGVFLTSSSAYLEFDPYDVSIHVLSGASTNADTNSLYSLFYIPSSYEGTLLDVLGSDLYKYDSLRGTNGTPEQTYTLARVYEVFYERFLSSVWGDDFVLSFAPPYGSSVQFYTAASYEALDIQPFSEMFFLTIFEPGDGMAGQLDSYLYELFHSAANVQAWSLAWAGLGVDISSNGYFTPQVSRGSGWFQEIANGSFLTDLSGLGTPFVTAESNDVLLVGGYPRMAVTNQPYNIPFLSVSNDFTVSPLGNFASAVNGFRPADVSPPPFLSASRGSAYFPNDSTNVSGSVEVVPDLSNFDCFMFEPVGVHAFYPAHANAGWEGVLHVTPENCILVGMENTDALPALVILRRPDVGSVHSNVTMNVQNRVVFSFSAPSPSLVPSFVASPAPASLPFLSGRSLQTNDLAVDGVPAFLR